MCIGPTTHHKLVELFCSWTAVHSPALVWQSLSQRLQGCIQENVLCLEKLKSVIKLYRLFRYSSLQWRYEENTHDLTSWWTNRGMEECKYVRPHADPLRIFLCPSKSIEHNLRMSTMIQFDCWGRGIHTLENHRCGWLYTSLTELGLHGYCKD